MHYSILFYGCCRQKSILGLSFPGLQYQQCYQFKHILFSCLTVPRAHSTRRGREYRSIEVSETNKQQYAEMGSPRNGDTSSPPTHSLLKADKYKASEGVTEEEKRTRRRIRGVSLVIVSVVGQDWVAAPNWD